MGLTQKLGTIPLAIQTDSSNNVGIGGAANASYKLAVTGASLFSSSVTAGSNILINNSGTTIPNIGATSAQGGLNLYSGATADYNGGGLITLVSSDRSGAYTRGEVYISAGRATNNTANGFIALSTSDTERVRIPSGGGLCVGGTSFSGLNTAVSVNSASNSGFILQTGGTNRGYFYTSGNNTYIETTNSGLLYCWVNGANGVYLTAGSTSWTANSDERLKDITGNIENAVDSLLTLRTVKHTWKTDEDKTEHLALIAQDVEKVLPQLIDKYIIPAKRGEEQTDETEYLGVRYTELIPVLVKAIQELSAKVTALENK